MQLFGCSPADVPRRRFVEAVTRGDADTGFGRTRPSCASVPTRNDARKPHGSNAFLLDAAPPRFDVAWAQRRCTAARGGVPGAVPRQKIVMAVKTMSRRLITRASSHLPGGLLRFGLHEVSALRYYPVSSEYTRFRRRKPRVADTVGYRSKADVLIYCGRQNRWASGRDTRPPCASSGDAA